MDDTPLSLMERLHDPNDTAAWRRLVALYSPLIRGWIRRQGVADADTDDMVQDILGALLKKMPTFEHSGRTGAFRHWLRTTTVYHLSDFWRARRSRFGDTSPVDLQQLVDPDSELSRAWDREHNEFVARRLLELMEPEFTQPTWLAFRRQVLDGLKAAEVAAELGTTVNAVLLSKSRVLRRLRQEGRGLID